MSTHNTGFHGGKSFSTYFSYLEVCIYLSSFCLQHCPCLKKRDKKCDRYIERCEMCDIIQLCFVTCSFFKIYLNLLVHFYLL